MPAPAPLLIALAGLPGTGKSTLARALAAALDAPVLDKDAVRAAMFGPERTDYSRAQDDLCMQAIYAQAAALVRAQGDERHDAAALTTTGREPMAGRARVAAILDGRTFSRHESVAALCEAARAAHAALLVVECRCDDAVAHARLAADAARGTHPAANRDVAWHRTLRDAAEPLDAALAPGIAADRHGGPAVGHLVLDTGVAKLSEQVARVRAALAAVSATV